MNSLRDARRLAVALARERAAVRWNGYVLRRPLALLQLGPGRDDPYAIYRRLRAQGPLVRGQDGWVANSHASAQAVLRDRRFGVRPLSAPRPVPGEIDFSFLDRDPPDHGRLRRLAAPAFTPRVVASYRPRIEATTHALLDDVVGHERVDLVAALAAPLPISVITDLLGIAGAQAADFAEYGMVLAGALDGITSLRQAARLSAADQKITGIFADLIATRTAEPGDDVISHPVTVADPPLTRQELHAMCGLLLVAGFETTVNLIGNGVLALLAHPDQWRALTAEPTLAGAVVEEVLRYDPPVQRTYRVAHEDVELAGQRVAAGEWVVVLLGAAGRDPEVYVDPSRFDVRRSHAREHLAFSAGPHYCLGAPLARLEAEVAFAALAARAPELAAAGRVTRRPSRLIRGPATLPVRAGRSSVSVG
jgi:cytochrome P450